MYSSPLPASWVQYRDMFEDTICSVSHYIDEFHNRLNGRQIAKKRALRDPLPIFKARYKQEQVISISPPKKHL